MVEVGCDRYAILSLTRTPCREAEVLSMADSPDKADAIAEMFATGYENSIGACKHNVCIYELKREYILG
jgi:hypothetical protein